MIWGLVILETINTIKPFGNTWTSYIPFCWYHKYSSSTVRLFEIWYNFANKEINIFSKETKNIFFHLKFLQKSKVKLFHFKRFRFKRSLQLNTLHNVLASHVDFLLPNLQKCWFEQKVTLSEKIILNTWIWMFMFLSGNWWLHSAIQIISR